MRNRFLCPAILIFTGTVFTPALAEGPGPCTPVEKLRVEDLRDADERDIYIHVMFNMSPLEIRTLEPYFDLARDEKVQDEYGDYTYDYLNHAIDRYLLTRNQERIDAIRSSIINWAKDEPDSVTAQALRIHFLIDYAWVLRGNKYVSDTTDQELDSFREVITDVTSLVKEYDGLLADDPLFLSDYARLQMIFVAPLEDRMETVSRSLEIFPESFSVIDTVAVSCLPRWTRSNEEMTKFAQFCYEETREDFGLTTYFIVARHAIDNDGVDITFEDFEFNLDDYLKGAKDYHEYYREHGKWSLNHAAKTLVHLKQPELAAEFFELIDGEYHSNIWNPAEFRAWEAWANGDSGGPKSRRIHRAAEKGDMEYFTVAVERGEDLNVPNRDGETPIHIAATNQHWPLVQYLAEHGADASISHSWNTPLSIAIAEKEIDTALTLLDHGADPNYSWGNENVPIWHAASDGLTPVVEALVSHPEINLDLRGGAYRSTAFMRAVSGGYMDIAKLLIDAGACIDASDGAGNSAIVIAAHNGNIPMLDFLLEHGAYVNQRDANNYTPIIYASVAGHLEVIERLLQEDETDPNHQGDLGETALIYAARHGHVGVVRALCDVEGIDLDAQEFEQGWTALHGAVNANSTGSIRALTGAGADLTLKDHKGQTPAEFARAEGKDRLVRYLEP